jgi:hypothetical protein
MAIDLQNISRLPKALQDPVGELYEFGRDFVEEWLKEVLGIGQVEQFGGQSTPTSYIDPHIIAARKQQLLYIMHVPSKKKIGLFAMLENLSNSYAVNWTEEPVYGRNDPIAGYTNTTRGLTLNFKLVAANLAEARFNYNKTMGRGGMERVSLSNMLYPTYKEIGNYKTIASPPIIALKHVQLVQSYGSTIDGGFLLGYITSCNITPNFAEGSLEGGGNNFIYPKVINIGINFSVLHDYDLGWKASTGFLAELFPEIGSGEDVARIVGGRLAGPLGAQVGAGLGAAVDEGLNSLQPAGEAKSPNPIEILGIG